MRLLPSDDQSMGRAAAELRETVVEITHFTKTLPCSGCGGEIVVGKNTVMAYCGSCSAHMGKKR